MLRRHMLNPLAVPSVPNLMRTHMKMFHVGLDKNTEDTVELPLLSSVSESLAPEIEDEKEELLHETCRLSNR
jgi:hypothetical protein